MAYTALYRQYRPKTFSEILGQEHITKTLVNQVIANKTGHAYLFTGGRGTGKTSAAKILARAVNCLNPKDGEPCNECENCIGALNGSLTDIVEMDAASNNGVDDIRAIRDEVNFLPTSAKYRIYIIDEVHMLSTGAFNALLKTLEEPPEHVKFILATTEPQKLPATIISRCQRFDFKKISSEDIGKQVKIICDDLNVKIDNDAINTISIVSEGAMRDALSVLERCLQEGILEISDEFVKEILGIPKIQAINSIVVSMINNDYEAALSVANELINSGKDISNINFEIIKYVKDVLLYKAADIKGIYNENDLKSIKEISDNTSKQRLYDIIFSLSNLDNRMRLSSQKQLLFQVEIIKLCENYNLEEEIVNKKVVKDIKIDNGSEVLREKEKKDKRDKKIENEVEEKKEGKKEDKVSIDENVGNVESLEKEINLVDDESNENPLKKSWGKISDEFKSEVFAYLSLKNAEPVIKNDTAVEVHFTSKSDAVAMSLLDTPENRQKLEKLISIECKKPMRVSLILDSEKIIKSSNVNKSSSIEDFAKENNIMFEEQDD